MSHRPIITVAALSLAACATTTRTDHVARRPDGTPRWQVELRHGVPDGPSVTWHDNGAVASRGSYRAGRRDGRFVYWDRDGREVRRETYADGQRVEVWTAPPLPGPTPGIDAEEPAPMVAAAAPPPPADRYLEVRLGSGLGVTNAAVRTDGVDDDQGGTTVGLDLMVTLRRRFLVYGVDVRRAANLFGPSYTHAGAVLGVASSGRRSHVELLAQGGLHVVSNLGADLFTESLGDGSVDMPYLGGVFRVQFDPGQPGHLLLDVAASARTDLRRVDRTVMTRSCFLGCSDDRETWRVGGHSADVQLGVSYRFD